MRRRRLLPVPAEPFAGRGTARVLGAAAIATALLLGGCGASRPAGTALTTRVAAPLEPVLAYLKHTTMPVYLPGWVPPTRQSQYTRYYLLRVRANADSYYVSFNFTSKPTPVNVTRPFDMAQQLGFIRGGPAGSLDSAIRRDSTVVLREPDR